MTAREKYEEQELCLDVVREKYQEGTEERFQAEEQVLKDMCAAWDEIPAETQAEIIMERAKILAGATKDLGMALGELKGALDHYVSATNPSKIKA